MALADRLRRLDDSVVPNAGWTWNLSSAPRWLRWFGYSGVVTTALAIVLFDQPWTTVIVAIDVALYLGLLAYYRRRHRAVPQVSAKT